MRQRVQWTLLVLVLSVICSVAVAGMIVFLLVACGVHVGLLLALLSLLPGGAWGVGMAQPLSRQLLTDLEHTHERRGTEVNKEGRAGRRKLTSLNKKDLRLSPGK